MSSRSPAVRSRSALLLLLAASLCVALASASAAAAPKKVVRVTSDLGARMSRTGLDHDFYCPREFVPGRPGGFHKVQSRQACCILDKSLAVMEVIYLMRKCTRFVHGGPSSTRWGACFTGAVDSIYWHLRACCVDTLFVEDHTERHCMKAIHAPLMDIKQQLKPHFHLCTSEDVKESEFEAQHHNKHFSGKPNVDHCHLTEAHSVRIIKRLHKAARTLFSEDPTDLTAKAKGFLAMADDDTLAKVTKLLKLHHGAPHDGAKCDGC